MTQADASNMDLSVGFWGTRGSISTPGRLTERYGGNTPCVSVSVGDTYIVLDAGTGARDLGLDLAREYRSRPQDLVIHLFLSHTHWDHIQGLPFFEPAYMRGVRLSIYGGPRKNGFLARILHGQMDYEYFPVTMSDFEATWTIIELEERPLCIDGITVDWQEQAYHPGGSVRYKVQYADRSIVYASDIELNRCFVDNPTPRQAADQRTYLSFVQEADLLIADGQFTDEEYPRVTGYGHSTVELLTSLAYQAGVRRLAVFHHDPQHTDSTLEALWRRYYAVFAAKTPPMKVFWAREGQILRI